MRAIVFERNGGPEVLELKEVPEPNTGDGEVLVDVEAIGINYRDVYEREGGGYGSTPPAIIGVEGAGTIADTGERVAWARRRQLRRADRRASRAARADPDGVSTEVAAAALLQGMTAHYLASDSLSDRARRLGAGARRGRGRGPAADPDRQAARWPRDRDHVDRREGGAGARSGRRRGDRLRRLRRSA